MTYTGEVVMWSEDRGIGFISCDEFSNDVYVHHTGFGGGSLIEGRSVRFDTVEEKGRRRAINVSGSAVERNSAKKRGRRSDSRDRDNYRDRDRDRDIDRRGKRMFVLKLREVEDDLTKNDIADFFEDNKVDIEADKTLFDNKIDTAYVVLTHQKDFDYVLDRMDGKTMPNGQRARIFKSGDRDYMKLARTQKPPARGGRRGRSLSSPSSRGRSYTPVRSRTPERRSRKPSRTPEKSRKPSRTPEKSRKPSRTPEKSRKPSRTPERKSRKPSRRSPSSESPTRKKRRVSRSPSSRSSRSD
ncbi:hypothetical protein DIPPA_21639 [Diplonema papillatum]|nr:hypothetical protein DIPPA_21639 [Diplonema papillatum]